LAKNCKKNDYQIAMLKNLFLLLKNNPEKIFLYDGFGALLTAFMLGVVLVYFQSYIGLSQQILYFLSFFAFMIALFSFYIYHFVNRSLSPFLKTILVLNILYCCLTTSVLFYCKNTISALGLGYFIVEISIISILIWLEKTILMKLNGQK
jgi:hypothetical protein